MTRTNAARFSGRAGAARGSAATRRKVWWRAHAAVRARSRAFRLLVVVAALAGCGHAQPVKQSPVPLQSAATDERHETIVIFGPPGFKRILTSLEPFAESADLGFEFEVWDGVSTSAGIHGVLDGTFDMMVLMRWPRPDEPVAFAEYLHTPVAIFVNPEVGIDRLSHDEVAAIFSGEITNWAQLGGPDQDIIVFVQQTNDAMTQAMQDYILGDRSFTQSARNITEERAVFPVVESVPGAVSYASWAGKLYWEFTLNTDFAAPVKLDGMLPEDSAYPFVSPIGIAYLPERYADLEPTLNWGYSFLQSQAAKALFEQFGVRLPQSDSVAP